MVKKTPLLILLALVLFLFSSCGTQDTSIKPPRPAEDYYGEDYEEVVRDLKKAGFTDIATEVLEDLNSDSQLKDGAVESVTIGDNKSFTAQDKFEPETKVIVTYHIIPKIQLPVSSEEAATTESAELIPLFEEAGLEVVSIEEVYDLDPDELEGDFINEVKVDGRTDFAQGEEVPFDSKISITCHFPYAKYKMLLHFDFRSNLLFDKYGINIDIDGNRIKSLGHGEDADYEDVLKEGDYTIAFSGDSNDNRTEVTLSLTADVEAEYQIHCHGDYIDVTQVYVDYQNDLGENEAKVICSENAFLYRNYNEVISELKAMGFTNIVEVPVYDVYFGILTSSGEVSEVTIDGHSDYKRGDVFNKDVEIHVSYHTDYDKDPEYIKQQEEEAKAAEEAKTAEKENSAKAENEKTKTPSATPTPSQEPEVSDYEIYDMVWGQPCSAARKYLAEQGYSVSYIHENTGMDFTGEIEYNSDEDLDAMGWYVADIEDLDTGNKTISLLVNTYENAARLDEQKSLEEKLESVFPAYMAVSAVEQYGKSQYGSSFKLHMMTGRLAETALDENTWFIKYTADVTIGGTKYKNLNCEAKVKGPESNPTVYDFNLY